MIKVKLIICFLFFNFCFINLNGQESAKFIFPNFEEQDLFLLRNYVNTDFNKRSNCAYFYLSELIYKCSYKDGDGSFNKNFISMVFFQWYFNDIGTLSGQKLEPLIGEYDFHRGGFYYEKKDSINIFETLKNYQPTLGSDIYCQNTELKNIFKEYKLPDYSRLDIFYYYFSNSIFNRIQFLELNYKKFDTYQIQIIMDDLNTLLKTKEKYPINAKGELIKENLIESIRNWKSNSLFKNN
ncbi:MAG: hypothetical protein IPO64_04080 [Bacteroidetes bacterium]|nr:hypothetical protein [Bacteroidota bacterium]